MQSSPADPAESIFQELLKIPNPDTLNSKAPNRMGLGSLFVSFKSQELKVSRALQESLNLSFSGFRIEGCARIPRRLRGLPARRFG